MIAPACACLQVLSAVSRKPISSCETLARLTFIIHASFHKYVVHETHRFKDGQRPPPPASSLEKLLMPWVLVLKAVFFCITLLQRCAVSMNAKSRQMAARHSRLKSKSLGS